MSCYVASNDNRIYAALETDFGQVGTVTAENRLPAIKLGIAQRTEQPERRDKTGGRTFLGLPNGFRKTVDYELTTYMTAWDTVNPAPCYGPLFQAGLGGAGLEFPGRTIQTVVDPTRFQTTVAHGLTIGQAVRFGGELRFVTAIVDPATFIINAPFLTTPVASSELGASVTYTLAKDLLSVSLFDHWIPDTTVQRIVSGGAVDRLRVRVNGDFHQFTFSGPAAELIDSSTFSGGIGGLTSFPSEPAGPLVNFSLVPGSLGQVWLGTVPSQFHTLLTADVILDNGIDLRVREFGEARPRCLLAGRRRVSVNLDLVSDTEPETSALYQAAAQRDPISLMFQLGQTESHLCAVYLPIVIPEVPEFNDDDARLEWHFRNSRAQGIADDELVIAFG